MCIYIFLYIYLFIAYLFNKYYPLFSEKHIENFVVENVTITLDDCNFSITENNKFKIQLCITNLEAPYFINLVAGSNSVSVNHPNKCVTVDIIYTNSLSTMNLSFSESSGCQRNKQRHCYIFLQG